MIIQVDKTRCTGHARCNAMAPELYELDDDGFSSLTEFRVPPEFEDAARDGAFGCPERAITIGE